jgi:SNF2 family DNA or RNA helicase
MKYKFVRPPRSYQLAALRKALEFGKLAIWFDPGLGKTKVAIDFTAIKIAKGEVSKILVVCPLSAIGVWEDEFPQDCPTEYLPKVVPVVGDMDDRIKTITEAIHSKSARSLVLVMNYESLRNDQVMALIKSWHPQEIIVDEMHYTKNANTQRSKNVYAIRKTCKFCLGLTGTPIPKDPRDLFGQYKIIEDSVFGADRGAFKRFKDRYCVMNFKFPSKVDAWKNLDELARKIHQLAYRAKYSECVGLPELIVQDIPVYFGSKSKRLYNQMATEMIAEIDEAEVVTASMAATKVLKLQQITGGFIMRKDEYVDTEGNLKTQQVTFPVGTEKLDVCMDLINRYVEHHKIIIGCRFIWEISQLESRLSKSGIGHATIRGGVSGDERSEIRRTFQADEDTRVIIFQISAATAMTLTAADIGILYSSTQKWDDYWQWLKRIHREGQNKPVYILRLIVKGSVDRAVIQSINEKRAFTDYMVDRQSMKSVIKLID